MRSASRRSIRVLLRVALCAIVLPVHAFGQGATQASIAGTVTDGSGAVALDLFNAFNAGTVLSVNQTYGPAWLTPTGVITARFVKVSARLDF
jgi:hypothetical protein